MSQYYRKRSLTFRGLLKLISDFLRFKPKFASSTKSITEPISEQFKEHIMLAVTSVNECVICSYFHSKIAIESGCSEKEINLILKQDLSITDEWELPALAFAQHFAESHESPTKKAVNELVKFYGYPRSKEIISYCYMITLGNLFGNTINAYESRLQGQKVKDGNPFLEAVLYYSSIRAIKKINVC